MGSTDKLTQINLYDKFNATFVNLVTPEMKELKNLRKANNYDRNKPTLERPFQMPFEVAKINGVSIRMAQSKVDEAKPNLLFLSAFPHTILAYSPIWNALQNDYNLFAYDLPGFGNSATNADFMTFAYQGDFLKSFLREFNIDAPHIVAPDVGMAAALSYVIDHKNAVRSLMIGDGPGVFPSKDPSIMRKMTRSGFWRFMFVMAGNGALIASAINLGNVKYVPNKFEISDYKKAHKGKVSNAMKWFKGYKENVPRLDAGLAGIHIPTKIFWGEHDAILFKDNAVELSKKMPHCELQIFENAGHFVYQDSYQEFTHMIKNWVNKHV